MNLKEMTYQEIQEEYRKVGYFCSDRLAVAVKNAMILNKPIVIEGPPGVGKTELAKATAKLLDREYIRLQCSPEMNERKALYDFNYSKQLMFIQLLKDHLVTSGATGNIKKWIEEFDQDNPFYSENFLVKRPILEAFCPTNQKPKVLLIDELDKADEEFEFSLLEPFSDYSISIPEIGTIQAEDKPVTIVTSNRRRKLTDTFLRRAIYLFIDYPTMEEETEILRTKTNANPVLAKQIAKIISELRSIGLAHNPSISESMEWAEVLSLLCEEEASSETLIQTISVIAKNQSDLKKITQKLAG